MSHPVRITGSPWQPLEQVSLSPLVRDWLADPGSLTRRLQQLGEFRVEPGYQQVAAPRPDERQLLCLPPRRWALIREVTLRVDGTAVVRARSILPLASLRGANRQLGHLGSRSLGTQLYRHPAARRDHVWVCCQPLSDNGTPCWGRQSRFIKRGRPLLVAEYFLPSLWQKLAQQG